MAKLFTFAGVGLPVVVTCAVACGGGAVLPAQSQSRESGQSSLMDGTFAGKNKCNPEGHERPFVIEWDATDMSSFEARAAKDVVFVRYVGCDLEVLDACNDDSVRGSLGTYKPVEWTAGSLEKVDIDNDAELYAKLPLGAAELGGRVEAGESFHMEYFVSGTRAATRDTVHRADIDRIKGCNGATHFVYAYNLGAFALASKKAIEGEIGASAFGFGAGGKRGNKTNAEKKGGELASCRGTMAKELQTCRVPIRLTLREISDGEGADAMAMRAPETADAKNLAGKLQQKGERLEKASELRQSATQKFSSGDGKGCIADLDAADRLDPKHPSTDPRGYLRTRGGCVMLAGQCDAGKRMVRQAMQATMPNMNAEMTDNVVEGDAGRYCQGGKMSARDQALKAANDLYKAHTERVDSATCRRSYDTLKRLGPVAGSDSQSRLIAGAPKVAPTCFASAGDCSSAWQVFEEQFADIPASMRLDAFEQNVKACKGKVSVRLSARDELLRGIEDLDKGMGRLGDLATCRRGHETVRRLGPHFKPTGPQDPMAFRVKQAPLTAMRCFAVTGDCATAKKLYFDLYPGSPPHMFAVMNYECQGK